MSLTPGLLNCMTAPHFGVKYPDGKYSGPTTTSRRAAAHYGRPYHAEVYEVGTADDPAPRHQREAEPWDFGNYDQQEGRLKRRTPARTKSYTSGEDNGN